MSATSTLVEDFKEKAVEALPGIISEAFPGLPIPAGMAVAMAEKLVAYLRDLIDARYAGAVVQSDHIVFIDKR